MSKTSYFFGSVASWAANDAPKVRDFYHAAQLNRLNEANSWSETSGCSRWPFVISDRLDLLVIFAFSAADGPAPITFEGGLDQETGPAPPERIMLLPWIEAVLMSVVAHDAVGFGDESSPHPSRPARLSCISTTPIGVANLHSSGSNNAVLQELKDYYNNYEARYYSVCFCLL